MTLKIEIVPEHYHKSKVYTTGSTVTGYVKFTSDHAVTSSAISIHLIGTAQKRLELSQLSNRKASEWKFLSLRMPVDDIDISSSGSGAQQQYHVPFNFTIPERLTLGTCQHDSASLELHESHIHLPPTMGFWERNDMSPEMTKIAYYIRVKACSQAPKTPSGTEIVEEEFRIKVLPTAPAKPPIELSLGDEQFTPYKSLSMRNGRIGPALGKLNVCLDQPKPVMLSADGHKASTTSTRLTLGFACLPETITPPRIRSITGQIISRTFYGPDMLDRWPHLGNRFPTISSPLHDYAVISEAIIRHVDKVTWHLENSHSTTKAQALSRHGPTKSIQTKAASGDTDFQTYPVKHLASVQLLLAIPNDGRKFFLPTFHSCHFSRTYTFRLSISTNLSMKCVKLEVPLQIGVEEHDSSPTYPELAPNICEQEEDSLRNFMANLVLSGGPPCYEES